MNSLKQSSEWPDAAGVNRVAPEETFTVGKLPDRGKVHRQDLAGRTHRINIDLQECRADKRRALDPIDQDPSPARFISGPAGLFRSLLCRFRVGSVVPNRRPAKDAPRQTIGIEGFRHVRQFELLPI